eukprot:CAMPEP_0118717192 /NCGR_PEP_ID=MMETSP0800-20121206/27980_1 /TAXON_ID=210618 ORGANISM="Striatella unipunctata, Strain CCMP2910" /NCGR_SAMPLE_ID=MMETSP0800 /ASSEMBLY_ACC=CAM_ASM_000638 /LENGTH=40 /DNA_ID= /DNA_START= /DNA_END= /DNA_ORIENTATION=
MTWPSGVITGSTTIGATEGVVHLVVKSMFRACISGAAPVK